MTAYMVDTGSKQLYSATSLIKKVMEEGGPQGDIIKAKNSIFVEFPDLDPEEVKMIERMGLNIKPADEVKIEM